MPVSELSIEDIRLRAYHLWQAAGQPDKETGHFWYEAEKQLLAERTEQGDVPPGMTDNLPV